MTDGPMACQTDGSGAGATAAIACAVGRALERVVRPRLPPAPLPSRSAALISAAASDRASGVARRPRALLAKVVVVRDLARSALFVSPNRGRAAFGTAMLAKT